MNKIYKNLSMVLISKLIVFILGIFNMIIVPIYLSKDNYALYKIYLLYAGYIGLLHFGFADGIYMKYGGTDYNDLPKEKFRGYFSFLFSTQLFFGILILVISFFMLQGERSFIFLFIALNIICVNIITYFDFITQITQKFHIYSVTTVLSKLITFIPILCIYFLKLDDYKVLIYGQTFAYFLSFSIYLVIHRSLIFGNKKRVKFSDLGPIYKIGIPLLLSNFISILIFSVDKQFIDIFIGDLSLFATYSFAISLLSIVLLFIDSFAQVMYPYIKRIPKEKYNDFYYNITMVICVLAMLGMSCYFPLTFFVERYLNKYVDSLRIFMILLPGVALRAEMSIAKRTFVMAENKLKKNMILNLIVLLFTIIANTIAVILFSTIESIAVASLISFIFWYLAFDYFFVRMGYKLHKPKYIFVVCSYIVYFILINLEYNFAYKMITYITSIVLVSIIIFNNQIRNLINRK